MGGQATAPTLPTARLQVICWPTSAVGKDCAQPAVCGHQGRRTPPPAHPQGSQTASNPFTDGGLLP